VGIENEGIDKPGMERDAGRCPRDRLSRRPRGLRVLPRTPIAAAATSARAPGDRNVSSALPPWGTRRKRLPRIWSSVGRSSSSQSLLSPWVTRPSSAMATIRCMTIVSIVSL
jgi:hypothetical protein